MRLNKTALIMCLLMPIAECASFNGSCPFCESGSAWRSDGEGDEDDYRKLCNELIRLMLSAELFVFVYRDGVDGNNNASERELRDNAMARKTGRTSNTPAGVKRRSIISSVLRSIGVEN